MAPTGQETQQIRAIDDLDDVNTSGKTLIKRNKSINNTAVLVAIKCVAEHDDLNPRETTNAEPDTNDKLQSETEDGSLVNVCYPVIDIACLGGVEASAKTSTLDSASAWDQSLDQSFQKNPPRTWRSSGKGKKRKKAKGGSKKKLYKKPKTDASMLSSNESLENFVSNKNTFAETEVPFVFYGAQTTACNTHEFVNTNCKITTGGRKHNTGTKGGRIATQQTRGSVKASNKMCSDVQSHRGGGGGGDGDDGDDGNKPPRKPPDAVLCCQTSKQKRKKKKTKSSVMEVDGGSNEGGGDLPPSSANDQVMVSEQKEQYMNVPRVQPEQPRQQNVRPTEQFVMILHNSINHNNYCTKRPCNRCSRVEMLNQHVGEMNGSCSCNKCQLWSYVLKYHMDKCQIKTCKVCVRAKKALQKPVPAAAVIQKNELNVPTCGQSLDQDDLIVWKDKCVPADITHFKEDVHYMLKDSIIGKGGHGAVQDMIMSDNVKKKMFNSDCIDFVMKKTKDVGEDEKRMFEETSKHPNFVQTYLVIKKTHPTFNHGIIMEKCETTLKDHLRKLAKDGKRLEIHEAMFYWTQTLDALKYLHNLRIPMIHKDVKAENVLLSIRDNLVRVKLADYDTVKQLHNEYTQPGLVIKGTFGLISPEVLRQQPHGRPADIWNMAMFLLQLLFVVDFTKLQKDLKNLQQMRMKTQDFVNAKIAELKQIDYELAVLIQRCLSEDPSKRPTATQVLKDPAVAEYIKKEINMDELIRQICPNLEAP